jgi:hypothetical protein
MLCDVFLLQTIPHGLLDIIRLYSMPQVLHTTPLYCRY